MSLAQWINIHPTATPQKPGTLKTAPVDGPLSCMFLPSYGKPECQNNTPPTRTPTTPQPRKQTHYDGELFRLDPQYAGTSGIGVSLCALACISLTLSPDIQHGKISLGAGPSGGISFRAGGSTRSEQGLFIGGSCFISGGPLGFYIEGGIQQKGPLGYGGLGLSGGAGVGCAVEGGLEW
jgi:hypothetical protein